MGCALASRIIPLMRGIGFNRRMAMTRKGRMRACAMMRPAAASQGRWARDLVGGVGPSGPLHRAQHGHSGWNPGCTCS